MKLSNDNNTPFVCECGYVAKTKAGLGAHKRAKHSESGRVSPSPLPPAAPVGAGNGTEALKPHLIPSPSPTPAGKTGLFARLFKRTDKDKQIKQLKKEKAEAYAAANKLAAQVTELTKAHPVGRTKKEQVGFILLAALGLGTVSATLGYMFIATELGGMPFLPLTMLIAAVVFIMRKDLVFNIKLLALKIAKRNPVVTYQVSTNKNIVRGVDTFNEKSGQILHGSKAQQIKVDWSPEGQLIDGSHHLPACIHVGADTQIKNLFSSAADTLGAKQIGIMLKDAEQLGELKATEKIDKLVQYAVIALVVVGIGTAVTVMNMVSIGELTETLTPLMKAASVTVKNKLAGG